jgi:hypothetical protein
MHKFKLSWQRMQHPVLRSLRPVSIHILCAVLTMRQRIAVPCFVLFITVCSGSRPHNDLQGKKLQLVTGEVSPGLYSLWMLNISMELKSLGTGRCHNCAKFYGAFDRGQRNSFPHSRMACCLLQFSVSLIKRFLKEAGITHDLLRRYVIKDVLKSFDNYGTNLGHKGYLISKVRSCWKEKLSIN